ncbi:MAG: hypothetical protein EA362_04055, partial [Saprospirales bacterium]
MRFLIKTIVIPFTLILQALVLHSYSLNAQCGGAPCRLCNITATVTNVQGGEIIVGTSDVPGPIDPGESASGTPLQIDATDCGIITLTVELDFDWQQGNSISWIHGISFSNTPNWVGAEGVIDPPDPGWIFLNEITGKCSGNTYGAGFYWDPPGEDCPPPGNRSNWNGTNCTSTIRCEEDHGYLIDGDPSDNWGIDCTDDCPRFGFELSYCPTTFGSNTEEITFFITEDGETGAWNTGNGCVFEVTIPIEFTAQTISFDEVYGPICPGECITLEVGEGCDEYIWSTFETTSSITVCPTETTTYEVTTFSDLGCETSGSATVLVEECCIDAGEITAIPSTVCPGEEIVISVSGYQESQFHGLQILIVDNNGVIVEVINSDVGSFSHPECETFTAYSYNFFEPDGNLPAEVGDLIADINCVGNCCDLISIPISFEDIEPPVFINPPADLFLSCISELDELEDLEWTDNCEDNGIAEGIETGSADLCNGGVITRTWIAEDACGNIAEHVQTITIEALVSPDFLDLPNDETVSCTDAPEEGVDLFYSNGLSGICEVEGSVTAEMDEDFTNCGGTITFSWSFTDECGNEITHQQIITIEDAAEPEFIDPPSDETVECSDIPQGLTPLSFSNFDNGICLIEGEIIPTVDEDYDICGGTITYSWETTDDCGRAISHQQIITIEPAPIAEFINPPEDITVECIDIPASAPDLEFSNGLSGDCEISGFVSAEVSGSADLCGGEIIYTWSFTDVCGREISHQQIITVDPVEEADFINPPEDITVDCIDIPSAAPDLEFSNGLSGDCEIFGFTSAEVSGSADLCGGEIIYTWSFTDACDREISHQQIITVDPVEEADFIDVPEDITVDCIDIPSAAPDLEFSNGLSGDCEISGFTSAEVSGSADLCGGEIIYIWSFVDVCDREISHQQIITVDPAPVGDFVNPPEDLIVDCSDLPGTPPDLLFTNNENGDCEIIEWVQPDVDGVVDICGGDITYTWEFTDVCGRMASHTQTITIDPLPEAEFIDPPDDIATDCTDLPGTAPELNYSNNLDGDCEIAGSVIADIDGEVDVCGSEIVYTWSFTDICDREISHSQTITIDPIPEAEFIDPPDDIATDCTDLPGAAPELSYSNNLDGDCEIAGSVIAIVDGEVDICGSEIVYTWTFTDVCDREISHSQTITIDPIPEAEFIDPPEDFNTDCTDLPGASPELIYSNNLDGDCEIEGSVIADVDGEVDVCGSEIVYTWTFTDVCDREISHSQTITIDPIPEAEFIDPPEDFNTDCTDLPGNPADLIYTNNQDGDCEISGTVMAEVEGEVDICGSEIIYIWTFSDVCDREISHSQTITIDPIPEAEFIDAPEDLTIACSELPPDPPVLFYSNNLDGDCEISGSVDPEVEGELEPCGSEIIYTWTYNDACDREITYIQTILVDPIPEAEFEEYPQDTTITCGGIPPDPPTLAYTNSLDGDCLIEGIVEPEVEGSADLCGGEIIYTWEYIDPCDRNIIHTQTITVEAVPIAVFDSLPTDLVVTCGEDIPPPFSLGYSNDGEGGDCTIEGSVQANRTGSIDNCGGTLVDTWLFTDDCGREISHSREIVVNPAPEAAFINPPEDLMLSCSESAGDPVTLAYTNNLTGDCAIEGEVTAVVSGNINICGGELFYTWTFTDECGREIQHIQTITQEPAPISSFIDPPQDFTVSCENLEINPPILNYSNLSQEPECLIEGAVSATVIEDYFACGGEILYVWTFIDECEREIEYIQTATVEPVDEPEFVNPPQDVTVDCDNIPPSDVPLNYTNNLAGDCLIAGQVFPEIFGGFAGCGGEIQYYYVFIDECGREIEHLQTITILPAETPQFINPPPDLNVICG